ncbi:hexose transporter, putative [Perkinsus marinus ATCC 50983]|uniref:Hexose transporter 1 n=1 Tax=Perkinsus marinus (strain ATCC 50983 / TXsc) TaxID=423536 RepID=C5L6T9_PERM5|nr:hexose transporter, putative [Perkinsus marinus ATCC 50983]EER07554.1 hexose transporter, putative [Perkinsus marinus ATCC 50983]|eukprot:XP_002775738.1 hexose transporter, putative [Perkinsus marinus ATCC 50983]
MFWEKSKKGEHPSDRRALLAVAAVLPAPLLVGLCCGFTAPAIDTMQNTVASPSGEHIRIGVHSDLYVFESPMTASFFSAALTLGALIASLTGGPISERTGRRLALLIAGPLNVISFLIIALCKNVAALIIARLIGGWSMGICSFVCSVYISEVSPTSLRGFLGSCTQLLIGLGILLVYIFGAVCRTDGESSDPLATSQTFCRWRLVSYICLIPGAVLTIAMFFAPETPRWLATRGGLQKAEETLRRLRGVDSVADPRIADEIRALEDIVEGQKERGGGSSDMKHRFKILWQCRKQVAIVTVTNLGTQFSGTNAQTFYQDTIFQAAGLSDSSVLAITVRVSSTIATLPCMYLLDRVGRRPLFISSWIGITISQLLMGIFFYFDRDGDAQHLAWLALLATYGYQLSYSWGAGPIRWMLASEIFPDEARGLASAIATTSNWGGAFFFVLFLESCIEATSMQAAFFFFSCVGAVVTVFEWFMVPETKGKTFEEIQKMFET